MEGLRTLRSNKAGKWQVASGKRHQQQTREEKELVSFWCLIQNVMIIFQYLSVFPTVHWLGITVRKKTTIWILNASNFTQFFIDFGNQSEELRGTVKWIGEFFGEEIPFFPLSFWQALGTVLLGIPADIIPKSIAKLWRLKHLIVTYHEILETVSMISNIYIYTYVDYWVIMMIQIGTVYLLQYISGAVLLEGINVDKYFSWTIIIFRSSALGQWQPAW